MRRKSLFCSILAIISFLLPYTVKAADAPIKREMRSAWVATVWQLDWPQTTITETGNTTQINQQKQQLIKMLDSLAINNMNAVNFQVRSRSDAMYKSSYEPWSTDLVSERGMDPGYDPLQFCIEECHKRGMECHAWINPYRYESVVGQWNGTPQCYRETNPEWLMDVSGASILNPGNPEVTQRIVDVIKEILTNYDVDGILFDDYFYLQGTPASADASLYSAYQENGGSLSLGDWRRDNVNKMVAAVYDMIQETKPWCRFGISPAGVACTSGDVANRYGVEPCPSGSDWQYSGIYSDPLAWISQQKLDYISPQVYWTIGYESADYAEITPWWAKIAAKWNRHFYTSHSISSLTASSKAATMSMREATIAEQLNPNASGPNSTTFEEFANEVRLNRTCTQNDAPGSIFYSCKYLYRTAPLFAHYLKKTVFNTPSLIPTMTHKPGYNPGVVTSLTLNGSTLTWTGYENVRYTVYAVPTSLPVINFNCEPEYLLGTSYATSYSIPKDKLSGYTYAVCVLDRYGYEYSPVFVNTQVQNLSAPNLTFPANGVEIETPFTFTWDEVTNATSYILEVATDAEFKNLEHTIVCNTNSCSSNALENLTLKETHYWRVRACATNYNDGISSSRSFIPSRLVITSPYNGEMEVSMTPTITWNIPDREVTVQISTSSSFPESGIIYSAKANGGSHTISNYKLGSYTSYHVRLAYERDGESLYSDYVSFTTVEFIPGAPVIKFPKNGGLFGSEDYIHVYPAEGIVSIRIEMSKTATAFGRGAYINEPLGGTWVSDDKAGNILLSGKNLVEGTTYYFRVRGKYKTPDGSSNTDYSDVISATYSGEGSGIESVDGDNDEIKIINNPEPTLYINIKTSSNIKVKAITPAGVVAGILYEGKADNKYISLNSLMQGIYLIIVETAEGNKVIKATI